MSENIDLVIYTDGGSRGNPGPSAYAYVIQRAGLADVEEKVYLGRTTNNVAEYTGLVKALEHARHLGAARVTIYSDSELMVRQMAGEYRVKNAGLVPLYEQAVRLRRDFESVTIRHVRREQNKQADRLCNEAMDHPDDAQPFPVPLPAADRSPAPAPAPVAPPADPMDEVRRRGVSILAANARRWAQGDPRTPEPEVVWAELWQMLLKAKAVRQGPKQAPRSE